MNILELAQELGHLPKRSASTNGGEYHCSCPDCGGTDRFCIWPSQGDHGRYWCRQCERHGDAIQFCRDFLDLSFSDACRKVGMILRTYSWKDSKPPSREKQVLQVSSLPSDEWIERANSFVAWCGRNLKDDVYAQKLVEQRGIQTDTAIEFGIGFNPTSIWDQRSRWGLPEEFRDDGKPKTVWLPAGLVVPAWQSDGSGVNKLKIRRAEWVPGDKYPKYVEVSGSCRQFAIYGDKTLPVIVVESELDAILIQQEARDLCCAVANGGVGKRPDLEVHTLLAAAPRVLLSLDFDEAGTKGCGFWLREYSNAKLWPVPHSKSPGDAFVQGLDLYAWIQLGIEGKPTITQRNLDMNDPEIEAVESCRGGVHREVLFDGTAISLMN